MTSEFSVAVHALIYLIHRRETLSSEALAENICTNPARIRKVMGKLKKAGLIVTKEGSEGGYSFPLNAEFVTLRQVEEAVGVRMLSCGWRPGDAEKECLVSSGMAQVMDDLYGELEDTCRRHLAHLTLGDMGRRIFGEGPVRLAPALPADAAAISRVFQQSWQTGYRGILDDRYLDDLPPDHWSALFSQHLGKDLTGLTAWRGEDLVGAAILSGPEEADYPQDRELLCFYVSPAAWGLGVGSRLLRQTLELARSQGAGGCHLYVFQGNERALRLYRAAGFRRVKEDEQVQLGDRSYPYDVYRLAF